MPVSTLDAISVQSQSLQHPRRLAKKRKTVRFADECGGSLTESREFEENRCARKVGHLDPLSLAQFVISCLLLALLQLLFLIVDNTVVRRQQAVQDRQIR